MWHTIEDGNFDYYRQTVITAKDTDITLAARANYDYTEHLITHYGVLLSVEDIASIFRYASGECVRKAHAAGRLPIKLGSFPARRGLYATAFSVAQVIGQFENNSLT